MRKLTIFFLFLLVLSSSAYAQYYEDVCESVPLKYSVEQKKCSGNWFFWKGKSIFTITNLDDEPGEFSFKVGFWDKNKFQGVIVTEFLNPGESADFWASPTTNFRARCDYDPVSIPEKQICRRVRKEVIPTPSLPPQIKPVEKLGALTHNPYVSKEDRRKYITPKDEKVLAKLDELTQGDYSEDRFGKNLEKIYYSVSKVKYVDDYTQYNVQDYWQTSDETLSLGQGDCDDYTILLQSLIEGLMYKTYGYIPRGAAYVVVGKVEIGTLKGWHAWNVIDIAKLPVEEPVDIVDTRATAIPASRYVVLGDIGIPNQPPQPQTVLYEPIRDRTRARPAAVGFGGRTLVELDSTFQMPLSYYQAKAYPYTQVYEVFNSQEQHYSPDFLQLQPSTAGQPLSFTQRVRSWFR